MTTTRTALIGALFAAFCLAIVAANIVTSNYGLIAAGFGLMVPAGTYLAGLTLGLRDVLHRTTRVSVVLAAIAVGAAISFAMGDARIALASGVAFLVSELLDLAMYTPLRKRGWRTAVVSSNAVGAVADTVVFLHLAGFGLALEAVGGQILVKAVWVTVAFLIVSEVVTRAVLPRYASS